MAGNAVVLRPDLQATLTALRGAELLRRAGLPDGLLRSSSATDRRPVRPWSSRPTTSPTPDPRPPAAPSPSWQPAPRRREPRTRGKNSLYVVADADLRRSVEGAVRASFSSAGQLCISTERIIVHRDIADSSSPARRRRAITADRHRAHVGNRHGDPCRTATTRHRHSSRRRCRRQGCPGPHRRSSSPRPRPHVYEPTVLADVTASMECRDGETFGPVVAIWRRRLRRAGHRPGQRHRLRPQRIGVDP